MKYTYIYVRNMDLLISMRSAHKGANLVPAVVSTGKCNQVSASSLHLPLAKHTSPTIVE